MTLEATRVWRRFIRSGTDTGKGVNVTLVAVLAALYVWILVAIVRYKEDISPELLVLEAILLTLIVPGSMYSAISGEREKLTWDGLIMTSLSPGQIVVGKLLWRVAIILGIAAVFVPALLLCHYAARLLGNASGSNPEYTIYALFLVQAIIVAWGLLLAGFSLWVSTKTKRTVTTLAIVTITLLSFLVLVPMLLVLFDGQSQWRLSDPPLKQLGSLLQRFHPLDNIWMLGTHGSQRHGDIWARMNLVHSVPWIYLGGAFACVFGAWKTLRGLEEPRVRS
jgi:ABC-type transport system involved in multi-copper enzyme maturation permease subunit